MRDCGAKCYLCAEEVVWSGSGVHTECKERFQRGRENERGESARERERQRERERE